MVGQYILNDAGEPVAVDDLYDWGRWLSETDRHVAKAVLRGGVTVSTVFLGLDHSFCEDGPPVWETMIFGGPHDGTQWRYVSREDAVTGHDAALAMALKTIQAFALLRHSRAMTHSPRWEL